MSGEGDQNDLLKGVKASNVKNLEALQQLNMQQQHQNQAINLGQGVQSGFIPNGNSMNNPGTSSSFALHNTQHGQNKNKLLNSNGINQVRMSNQSSGQFIPQNQQSNSNAILNGYNNVAQSGEPDEMKEDMRKKVKVETNSNHSGSNSGDNMMRMNIQPIVTATYMNYSSPSKHNLPTFPDNANKQLTSAQQTQLTNLINQATQPLANQQQQTPLQTQPLQEEQFRVIQQSLQQLKEQNNIQSQQLQQQQAFQQQVQQMIPELSMIMQNQNLNQTQFQLQQQMNQLQQQNQSQQQTQQIQKNNILSSFLNSILQQQQQQQAPAQLPQAQMQPQAQVPQIQLNPMMNQKVYGAGGIQNVPNTNQVIFGYLQNNAGAQNNAVNANNNVMSAANQMQQQQQEDEKSAAIIQQIQDFYQKIVSYEEAQSTMIKELYQKSNHQFDLITHVRQEIHQIRESIKISNAQKAQVAQGTNQNVHYDQTQVERANLPAENAIGVQGANGLLQYLFQKQDSDYKYELKPSEEIAFPFYRERNFSIKLQLYDRQGNIVQNQNKIILTMALYTSEINPQVIKQNTLGNQILKGFLEKELYQGKVSFEKIQIKEVTSHYLNGWIYMIIFPKNPKEAKQPNNSGNSSILDLTEIKPLILEKIIVKAKKMRENSNKAQNPSKGLGLSGAQKNEEDKSSLHSEGKLSHQQINSTAQDASGAREEEDDDEMDEEEDIDNDCEMDDEDNSSNNQGNDSSQQKKSSDNSVLNNFSQKPNQDKLVQQNSQISQSNQGQSSASEEQGQQSPPQ